jgi:hypothetical protein
VARSVFALCALAQVLLLPAAAFASDMDLALSRLHLSRGNGGCVTPDPSIVCADNAAFERLVSELSVTLAPAVNRGAASLGPRGFYVGVSSTGTPISPGERYWTRGTVGDVSGATANASPDALLVWNRLDVRKGLPFGFEIGSSLGQGIDTSMWLFAGELKWALFEGYHSGAGQLPDVAVRGTLQTTIGSRQLSLQTSTLDVTLSKPFVVGEHYKVTPFAALALLFVRATTGRIDLTPNVDVFSACGPQAKAGSTGTTGDNSILQCTKKTSTDVANYAVFDPVSQMRTRMFMGLEASERFVTMSASLGFDLTTPQLSSHTASDGWTTGMVRQFSFHLAFGLRY